jgi:multidrug resistance efflux pump
MLRITLLSAGIAAVVALGLVINSQSQTPTIRPAGGCQPQCTIFAIGRVEGATPEIELRPRLAGRIVELPVKEGQFVEDEQVLLQLDDQQYRCELALANAELNLANAELDRLRNGAHVQERTEAEALYRAKAAQLHRALVAWERIKKLSEANAVSQQQADDQRMEVDALSAELEAAKARLERVQSPARPDEVQIAQSRIQAAKARLELANVQMERTKLRAPCAGQILEISTEIGELAGPSSSEPAVIMADTTRPHVRAFVEELDAPRVEVGMAARIVADGLPGRVFRGRVTRLSPRMQAKELYSNRPAERYDTKTREVWIELEQAAGLVVGLPVDVTIDPQSAATAAAAPSTRLPARQSYASKGLPHQSPLPPGEG